MRTLMDYKTPVLFGLTAKKGYDLVDHCEEDDDNIRDVYHCPKCGKDAVRHYEFDGWDRSFHY